MKQFLIEIFTWWNGQTLGTRFFTWRKGIQVGQDAHGNRYYRNRGDTRRWVLYNGEVDASLIPPDWHGWMHHRNAHPPQADAPAYVWQLPHRPNATGSPDAYRPAGSLLHGGERRKVSADYVAWQPGQPDTLSNGGSNGA